MDWKKIVLIILAALGLGVFGYVLAKFVIDKELHN